MSAPVTDHRGDSAPAMVVGDDYPLGEIPDVTMVDLLPLEARMRAWVAMATTWEMLAHFIGFDLFPSIPAEFADILHLPAGATP